MAETYRLFAAKSSTENMETAAGERFSRITADYILIYRKRKPRNIPCVEIKGSDTKRLTEKDCAWLKSCIMTLLREAAETAKEETGKRLSSLVTALEEALREEQEKLEGDAGDGGTEGSDN